MLDVLVGEFDHNNDVLFLFSSETIVGKKGDPILLLLIELLGDRKLYVGGSFVWKNDMLGLLIGAEFGRETFIIVELSMGILPFGWTVYE